METTNEQEYNQRRYDNRCESLAQLLEFGYVTQWQFDQQIADAAVRFKISPKI